MTTFRGISRLTSLLILTVVTLAASHCSAQSIDVSQHQWVKPDLQGLVTGRAIAVKNQSIQSLRSARIALIRPSDQEVIAKTVANARGQFQFPNLAAGVYTLQISGANAFGYGTLHVMSAEIEGPDSFEFTAGLISPDVVKGIAQRYQGDRGKQVASFDPKVNPLETDRAAKGRITEILQRNDGLRGRINVAGFAEDDAEMASVGTNVLIYQGNRWIARTVTNADGDFFIADLPAGSYTVVAAGADGVGVMGVSLLSKEQNEARTLSSGNISFVTKPIDQANIFVMQVGQLAEVEDEEEDEEEEQPASEPQVANAAGGGGGGGGGGAGGSGGAAVAAAAIVVGAAVANQDDDPVNIAPPASPVNP